MSVEYRTTIICNSCGATTHLTNPSGVPTARQVRTHARNTQNWRHFPAIGDFCAPCLARGAARHPVVRTQKGT
jgi:hypothetical protein